MGGAASSQSHDQIEVRSSGTEDHEENVNTVSDSKEKHIKSQHNSDVIVRDADGLKENQHEHIKSRVPLNMMRKKHCDDEESGLMLNAKQLSITWSENQQYWQWIRVQETSGVGALAAWLLNVCWLEVHGTIKKSCLAPASSYQVAFVVMLKDPAYGWETPINLRLATSENMQEHKVCLMEKPRGVWIELQVGHFMVDQAIDASSNDEVQFSMFEYEGGLWKRGLVVKGAIIRPKKAS